MEIILLVITLSELSAISETGTSISHGTITRSSLCPEGKLQAHLITGYVLEQNTEYNNCSWLALYICHQLNMKAGHLGLSIFK